VPGGFFGVALSVVRGRCWKRRYAHKCPSPLQAFCQCVVDFARRRGVANVLMRALEADARRRGAMDVLATGTEQPEGISRYPARGYLAGDRYQQSESVDLRDSCDDRGERER
jgi:GNAT superfamily N-acetyltransferase